MNRASLIRRLEKVEQRKRESDGEDVVYYVITGVPRADCEAEEPILVRATGRDSTGSDA